MNKLHLFVFSGVLSLWLVFQGLPTVLGKEALLYLTYPILLFTVALWGWSLFALGRRYPSLLKRLLPSSQTAWLAILLAGAFHLLIQPFGFKIVLDEVILSACAQILHLTRVAGLAQWANDNAGSYEFIGLFLDKRPFLFPFILSLVHDLSGFRYQNVFVLNGTFTLLLMTALYCMGKVVGGHRGGILALLLTITLPVLSIMACSGHFEILNLLLLSLILLLSLFYLRQPDDTTLVPLVLTLVLLAQVRYENALYLFAFGLLILSGWKQAGRVILPWPVLLSPLLLVMVGLHLFFILNGPKAYFQTGPSDRVATFSLAYVPENLESAVRFFFGIGGRYANSFLLTVAGLAALLLFLHFAWTRSRKDRKLSAPVQVLIALMGASGLLACVILIFNYGLLDHYITSRLSLPLYLFLILLVPFVARRYGKALLVLGLLTGLVASAGHFFLMPEIGSPQKPSQLALAVLGFSGLAIWIWKGTPWKGKIGAMQGLTVLVALYILTIALPLAHDRPFSQRYQSDKVITAELAFLHQQKPRENFLWVTAAPFTAFLNQVNCAPPYLLNAEPQLAHQYLDSGRYESVYASRIFNLNPDGSATLMEPKDYLDPALFHLEIVKSQPLGMEKRHEIVRLTVLPQRTARETDADADVALP